jgi:hypothetical protein
MQLKYWQFLAALRQALRFLDANSAALGTINASGARRELDDAATRVDALGETQGSARRQGRGELTNELRLARALRRRNMRPIVRIARAKVPQIAQLSSMSLPPLKTNSTALAGQAGEIAKAVQPYEQIFVDAGLPADFIARMRAAADELVQSIGGKGAHRSLRTGATKALDTEVQQARRIIGVLDGLVRAQLDEQDKLVTEWRSASRAITGGGPQAKPPVATPQPTAPAVPATAPTAAQPKEVPTA